MTKQEQNYIERQAMAGFKVGDKVKFVRLFDDNEFGAGVKRHCGMENSLQKIGRIICINPYNIVVEFKGIGYNGRYSWQLPFFAIEKVQKPEIKPGDMVLVRQQDNDVWLCDIFTRYYDEALYANKGYLCTGGAIYEQCIPFFGNEDLAGTTRDPD